MRLPRLVLLALAAFHSWSASAQYDPPRQVTASPGGVNLADGRFTYQVTDLSIGPFTLERSYLGGNSIEGSNYFGRNWTHNYAFYVGEGERSQTDKTIVILGRSAVHFTRFASVPSTLPDRYVALNPDANGSSLRVDGNAFVYTDREGNVYTFNPAVNAFPPLPQRRNQRIARVDYANGHTLTYTYNGSGQLTQIASNQGYSLVFRYATNGYVSQACGFNLAVAPANATCSGAPLSVSYAYAAVTWPNLIGVVDAAGQTWGYDYANQSSVSQLTCVRQVNSSSCLITNTYGSGIGIRPRWVMQQTMADNSVWTYNFYEPFGGDDPQLPGEAPPESEGSYTSPDGLTVYAEFGGGLLNSITNHWVENGVDQYRRSAFTWNGIELASLAHPEGNALSYARDIRGNITLETWAPKPSSSTAAVSRTITYPDGNQGNCTTVTQIICNRPIERTDYRGATTNYAYDPVHGGLLRETGPAPVINGARPETRHEYAQRYAWVSNGAGGYVQAATPVWVRTATSTCANSAATGNPAAPCATTGDEIRTTYDYGPDSGPNNLLLRGGVVNGPNVTNSRTCYGYDALGRRISETGPGGTVGWTSCP